MICTCLYGMYCAPLCFVIEKQEHLGISLGSWRALRNIMNMRTILTFTILILISFASYSQKIEYKDISLKEKIPKWATTMLDIYEYEKEYVISDYLEPFKHEYDFNRDFLLDVAVLIEEKATEKKGILIIHNKNRNSYIVGAGTIFGNGGDDFKWMNIWKYDRIDDIIGLYVEKSESASGFISWNGKKYIWTQLSD